jgi:superfamily II DNA or RNA helicase
VLEKIRGEFEHHNSHRAAMKAMGVRGWWAEEAIVKTWRVDGDYLSLPRGGLKRVLYALDDAGILPEVEDNRLDGAPDLGGQIPAHRVTLRDYQQAAVNAAEAAETGIIRAPTGSGKTTVGFAIAARLNLPTLALVPTVALLKQWLERAESELGIPADEVGIIHGKRRVLAPLTVGLQATLAAHGVDEELRTFPGLVLFDEASQAPAGTFFRSTDAFPARYRIGLTADEKRKDRKEFLGYDLFGEVVYEIRRRQLEDEGHVLDVAVHVLPTEFEAPWYGLSDSPEDDVSLDFQRLGDEMAEDERRNLVAVRAAQQAANRGELVFVMARRREHCQRLAAMLTARGVPTGFLIGGKDYESEFDATVRRMRGGDVRVGVGTIQSIGVGVDFPQVGVAVVAAPIAGNKQLLNQVRGRVCRAPDGKTHAVLAYLWDQRCSYGRQHLRNIIAWNRRVGVMQGGAMLSGREYLKSLRDASMPAA